MGAMRFGCQTYTWQMTLAKRGWKLDHIMDQVRRAGMAGIEAELCMLGAYRDDPRKMKDDLAARGLELAALCLVCDWRHTQETAAEKAEADWVIGTLKVLFPQTVLALCQMPGEDRSALKERQDNCLACVNAIGRRASDAGLKAAFHPNSPPGSVFRTQSDYEIMLAGLDTTHVGFAPDAGHIAKGGMDPVEIFRGSLRIIRHVHFKDMTAEGTWAEMGAGAIDFPEIIKLLAGAGYGGWVMIEDESPRAEVDPDDVTFANGRYIRSL